MSTKTETTLATTEVAVLLGVSYRQVDWLTRTGRVTIRGRGSGSRTRWDLGTVRRLHYAVALAEATSHRVSAGVSRFPAFVDTVMRARKIPESGWALVQHGEVRFVPDEVALAAALVEQGGVVVPLAPLAEQFDERIDDLISGRESHYAGLTRQGAQYAARMCEQCGVRCHAHRPSGGW